jgi:HemY protein
MLRVVVFLALVCLIALGAVWLEDRPGQVAITWLGWEIETSVMVLLVAIAALAAAIVLLLALLRVLLRSPHRIGQAVRNQRHRKERLAITRGLIAVGIGDRAAALRFAREARRSGADDPLALLLGAQAAQLEGDRASAEQAFREMAKRPETKLLGLRGLFIEAQRRQDAAAAQHFAEEAAKTAPALPWAGQAALEFRCRAEDWEGAIALLTANMRNGLIDKPTFRRHNAVLLTARALALRGTDAAEARRIAVEAAGFAPDLVPAAALAGRLLASAAEFRKARKILETAWRANPHPDLAETYAHLRPADSARERLSRIEALVRQAPGHAESALALARAALDAREFRAARNALEPLLEQPTQRVALLMAEIEEMEHNDVGRSREWMARALHAARDPCWAADGVVSEEWMPLSPVSGRIDAFEWRVPVAELPAPAPKSARAQTIAPEPSVALSPGPHGRNGGEAVTAAAATEPASSNSGSREASGGDGAGRPQAQVPSSRTEEEPVEAVPVIPLVHAPDDPGPESEPAENAHAENERTEGWRPFGSLFR